MLDEICYFFNPWTYDDGVTVWKVGKDGYINGVQPIIGYPPLISKGKKIDPSIKRILIGKKRGKAPRSNEDQNKQTRYLAQKYHLTKKQERILHDYINKEGLGYHEIEDAILDLFFR